MSEQDRPATVSADERSADETEAAQAAPADAGAGPEPNGPEPQPAPEVPASAAERPVSADAERPVAVHLAVPPVDVRQTASST